MVQFVHVLASFGLPMHHNLLTRLSFNLTHELALQNFIGELIFWLIVAKASQLSTVSIVYQYFKLQIAQTNACLDKYLAMKRNMFQLLMQVGHPTLVPTQAQFIHQLT